MNEETISVDGRKFQLMGIKTGNGEVILSCDSEIWWRGELHELHNAIEKAGKANTICCERADIPFVKSLLGAQSNV